jgi:hypothetical protein
MKFLCTVLAVSFCVVVPFEANAASKPDKRSKMTDAQKKELRKRGREWCRKNHAKGNAEIISIDILSNGSIRCWFRG